MKKTIALLIILLFAAESPAIAAKKKRDKRKAAQISLKEWKKRKKNMTPIQFKDIIEENHRLKVLAKKLKKHTREREAAAVHGRRELEKIVVSLKAEVTALKKAQSEAKASADKAKLQREQREYLTGTEHPTGESGEGHGKITYKIQVGVYHNYKEAERVKNKIRAQGHNDTWIIVFKDGKRIPLKEVLSEVLHDK